MRITLGLAAALVAMGAFCDAHAQVDAGAAPIAPVSAGPPSAVAVSAPPAVDPRLTRRKCTAWAAHAPTTTRDFVFQRERLVQRATEEMEVAYQLWDIDDTLDDAGADEACRTKTRAFCTQNTAAPGLCRFQVHVGLTNGGWDAAASIDSRPKTPKKKRPKTPAPQGKGKRKTP